MTVSDARDEPTLPGHARVLRHILAAAAALALADTAAAQDDGLVERGHYLSLMMGCDDCHTPRLQDGSFDMTTRLSGGSLGFELPGMGVFYPPNLTSDADTGLGGWSDAEIQAAIMTGVRPDGRILAPIMPWPNFAYMEQQDADALIAFLRSLPPVDNQVPGPSQPGESAPAPYFGVVIPGQP